MKKLKRNIFVANVDKILAKFFFFHVIIYPKFVMNVWLMKLIKIDVSYVMLKLLKKEK